MKKKIKDLTFSEAVKICDSKECFMCHLCPFPEAYRLFFELKKYVDDKGENEIEVPEHD